MVIWLITIYCQRKPINHPSGVTLKQTFAFHTLKLSPLTALSRRPQSEISKPHPLHGRDDTTPSPSAPNDARSRTPTSDRT